MAKRHSGGQEFPDDLQDRPEQNRAYDEAVEMGEALDTADELETEMLERVSAGDELSDVDDDVDVPADPDEKAERDVLRELRRRERSAR
jgi:hypothetical protein